MYVSVVIPTRNAVDRLLYTLYSLNLQYTPFEEFEVIIVDNASTDGLAERLRLFQAHYQLLLFSCKKRCSSAQLRNIGIDKARGELIIFLGCNMIVPRDFIGTHQQAHANEERLVLAGSAGKRIYSVYYPAFSQRQQEECQQWLVTYPQVKRPHTLSKIVRLIDEKQIASGLLFDIAMPASSRGNREAGLTPSRSGLPQSRQSWTLFHTKHLSVPRSAFTREGYFREMGRVLRDVEKDMAKRLWRANYQFRHLDKLTLLRQEYPRK